MSASNLNVDVILTSNIANVPSCPHGPTLLFERFVKGVGSRQFFACSAYRDRKQCRFFRWADDMKGKYGSLHSENDTGGKNQLCHPDLHKRFLLFKKLPHSKRTLCCTCSLLLLPAEIDAHNNPTHHTLKTGITHEDLRRPSTLFSPQENNKTLAQYLFSESTVDFILSSIESLSFSHVLCIGAPRIHEAVTLRQKEGQITLTSLLLDLDTRYAQVYSQKKLCIYNMFNHHFFDSRGEQIFKSFLTDGGKGVVLLTDPPFGGMVEALVATFCKIDQTWKDLSKTDASLPILWFFPYFMERRITDCMPSLTMLDYKVDYENHTLFNTKDGKKKKGSPVRIFTNISPTSLPLSAADGYWYCGVCDRYSASENKHCDSCQSCTSKDGTTYVHCNLCKRCVKPSRVHCSTCNVCDLPTHTCGQSRTEGCHICGSAEHKRRDCPRRHKPVTQRGKKRKAVRKAVDSSSTPKKYKSK